MNCAIIPSCGLWMRTIKRLRPKPLSRLRTHAILTWMSCCFSWSNHANHLRFHKEMWSFPMLLHSNIAHDWQNEVLHSATTRSLTFLRLKFTTTIQEHSIVVGKDDYHFRYENTFCRRKLCQRNCHYHPLPLPFWFWTLSKERWEGYALAYAKAVLLTALTAKPRLKQLLWLSRRGRPLERQDVLNSKVYSTSNNDPTNYQGWHYHAMCTPTLRPVTLW